MIRLTVGCRAGIAVVVILFASSLLAGGASAAQPFKIGIMQAQAGTAKKFAPLESYLAGKGGEVKFVPIANYPTAAKLFSRRDIDGMFSGSAVAGILILKGSATPLVRPVDPQGRSKYWAVVIGRKGGAAFTARQADYFAGKKVAFPGLASAGDFFFKSLQGAAEVNVTTVIAANHEEALEKLSRGEVDYAIVKNTVWEALQGKYPDFALLGQDPAQNPHDTLIVAKGTGAETSKALSVALMGIEADPHAAEVRLSLGIKGFTVTSPADFSTTLGLLKRAGVTAQYEFK